MWARTVAAGVSHSSIGQGQTEPGGPGLPLGVVEPRRQIDPIEGPDLIFRTSGGGQTER
jgi:hypothetical protein